MPRIDRAVFGVLVAVAVSAGSMGVADSRTTGAVSGLVLDEEKQPLRRVLVFLTSADGERSRRTRTDREGVFRFDGVANGIYSMVLSKSKYNTIEVPVVEVDGEEATIEFEIYPEWNCDGPLRPKPRVSGPSGVYLAGEVDDIEGFFPPGVDEEWYGSHLEAMNEPSMLRLAGSNAVESYRLLWLRSLHRPVAVRVELQAVVPPAVTVKILDGESGYEAGELEVSTERSLSQAEVGALRRALIKHGFWDLPQRRQSEFLNDQGQECLVICSDGARWILEAAVGDRYRVIDWECPYPGDAVQVLGEHLLGLSDLAFDPAY